MATQQTIKYSNPKPVTISVYNAQFPKPRGILRPTLLPDKLFSPAVNFVDINKKSLTSESIRVTKSTYQSGYIYEKPTYKSFNT